jgi:hypothetical protein
MRKLHSDLGILVVVFFFVITSRPAFGYIDPGTGQLAWQLIITTGLGLLFSLKKVLRFFKRRGRKTLPR